MVSEKETLIQLERSSHAIAGQDTVIKVKFHGTESGGAFNNINGFFMISSSKNTRVIKFIQLFSLPIPGAVRGSCLGGIITIWRRL